MSATLILRTIAAGGLRPEFEHPRTRHRRAVQSPKDASSPRSREINENAINGYGLSWKRASEGQKVLLLNLWRSAMGTVLPMQFTPMGKTDAAVEDVYFAGAPKIRRASPVTWAMDVDIEGRH